MKIIDEIVQRYKVLVTGVSSGLGAYLVRYFEGTGIHWSSFQNGLVELRDQRFEIIVHCAADTRQSPPAEDLYAYHESNFNFTDALLKIPHRLFVYLSSVDVYSDRDQENHESTPIRIDARTSVYALFKLMGEQLVRKKASTELILRPTSIVGPFARNNNIMKILTARKACLTVHAESTYNLVEQHEIAHFIDFAANNCITGTFNLGATRSALLADIAYSVGCHAHFGQHLYRVPQICTRKVREVAPFFQKDTICVAREVKSKILEALQKDRQ